MKKFELFIASLGNGYTVCNKAVEENGDYKVIARISCGGNIKLYVPESYIPEPEMEKINRIASERKIKYISAFEKLPIYTQYGKILDSVSIEKFLELIHDKTPIEEKLPIMREYYYSIA